MCSVIPEPERDELHAVRVMEFAKAMLRVAAEVRGARVRGRRGARRGEGQAGSWGREKGCPGAAAACAVLHA